MLWPNAYCPIAMLVVLAKYWYIDAEMSELLNL